MATIVTRETTQTDGTSPKGSPLTNAEVDTNFINLNDDKVEVSGAIIFQAKAAEALSKGDVVYVSGVSGNNPVVSKADADDASKMPAFGLAEADANLNAEVNVVTFGTLYDLDTSAFSAGDTVYVSTTAGGLTATKPAGETSLIQNLGLVIRSHASAGSIKVGGAGRTNAVPNLNDGNVFIGNASNQAETRALVEADISDLQAYLTAETNDLTAAVTWANVPDANITQSSVTQHQAALSITESQISDLQSYLTAETDTLDSVTGRGATTTNSISVGGLTVDTDTLVVDSTNNRVGIGEPSPDSLLHLKGSDPIITVEDTSAGGTASFQALNGSAIIDADSGNTVANSIVRFDIDGSEKMRIDNSGNVGIGTNSPSSYNSVADNLVVGDVSGNNGITILSGTAEQGSLFFGDGTGASAAQGIIRYKHSTNALELGTANTGDHLVIDSSGNVGINTTDPQSTLDCAGTLTISGGASIANSTDPYMRRAGGNLRIAGRSDGGAGGNIMICTGSSEDVRFTVDPSGNITAGDSLSSSTVGPILGGCAFEIRDTGGSEFVAALQTGGFTGSDLFCGGFAIRNSDPSGDGNHACGMWGKQAGSLSNGYMDLCFAAGRDLYDAESPQMILNTSGNLLVGRTSGVGSERLAVKSTALTCTFYSANSTANGTLMSYYSDVGGTEQQVAAMQRDGDIANTNNSYGALSDQRLKSNIVDASSQIDDIMAVQVRSYTLNSTGDTHIGVVAQELEEAGMSGLVKENEEGIKAVKYSVLYMKAIKALQEAVTRIETLEAEVAALKGAN
jgi:hypothetical protein